MTYQVLAPDAQPCVWMCAGLISYRLCNRDFDCENCPLDAALHRDFPIPSSAPAPEATVAAASAVPDDRRYSAGHTWVRPIPSGGAPLYRVGLDAFAAAILGSVSGVRCRCTERPLGRGDLLCELELAPGMIAMGCPVPGRLVRGNPSLRDIPDQVLDDPYGEGWIAEITDVDPDELLLLEGADEARARTGRDLNRFRREVALRLFADMRAADAAWGGMGRRLTDLRQILGRAGYVELLAELVH